MGRRNTGPKSNLQVFQWLNSFESADSEKTLFERLVLASGGVPRDFLSLLLESLSPMAAGEERVGKDDVRLLSLTVLQRRIDC